MWVIDLVPLFGLVVGFAVMFVIYPRVWRRRSQRLIAHVGGRFYWASTEISFDVDGREFVLTRASSGTGWRIYSGSFPTLRTFAAATEAFFVGHPECAKYIAIGDMVRREPTPEQLRTLFDRPFACLSVQRKLVFAERTLKHRWFARYWGLPDDIYERPELLLERARALEPLLRPT